MREYRPVNPGPAQRAWCGIFLCAILIAYSPLQSMEASPFILPLRGFSPAVLAEEASLFSITSSDKNFSLMENCSQKIVREDPAGTGKTILVKTGALTGSCPPGSGSGFLEDTRFLNLGSPEIRGMAARFRGSREPAADIERFVYAHISKKIIGIPLLTAAQIAESRTGDCTEHAVLAVALLRSLGIPARGVVGMYLSEGFEGHSNVFVYHMWAEALTEGKWQILDATRPGKKQLNRYVAFAYHSLKTEMPLAFLRAMSALRDMKVEYVPRQGDGIK